MGTHLGSPKALGQDRLGGRGSHAFGRGPTSAISWRSSPDRSCRPAWWWWSAPRRALRTAPQGQQRARGEKACLKRHGEPMQKAPGQELACGNPAARHAARGAAEHPYALQAPDEGVLAEDAGPGLHRAAWPAFRFLYRRGMEQDKAIGPLIRVPVVVDAVHSTGTDFILFPGPRAPPKREGNEN